MRWPGGEEQNRCCWGKTQTHWPAAWRLKWTDGLYCTRGSAADIAYDDSAVLVGVGRFKEGWCFLPGLPGPEGGRSAWLQTRQLLLKVPPFVAMSCVRGAACLESGIFVRALMLAFTFTLNLVPTTSGAYPVWYPWLAPAYHLGRYLGR